MLRMFWFDGVSISSGRVKAAVCGLEAWVGVAETISAPAVRTPGAGGVCVCLCSLWENVSDVMQPENRLVQRISQNRKML